MLWTSEDAAMATGGISTTPWVAKGVSIDTRTLHPGDLFVALTDVRDGHGFVMAALAKGAAAAMVARRPDAVAPDAPLLIVPEVLPALEALARLARARTRARVVGVTGSVGKTSTKEMLRVVLGRQGRVHASEASYNNHWGVPLTLARMPVETDYAVIEIGMNHPGEIAPLARMSGLDVALITTVAAAHLEAFESIAGIAEEKAAILEGLVSGGTAILPQGLEVTPILTAKAAAVGARVLMFGVDANCDYRLISAGLGDAVTVVQAARPTGPLLFKVRSPGRHFALNALAALAVADVLGLDPAIASCDIGEWQPPPGRGTRQRIRLDLVEETDFDLFDDAFNANPASMAASLDVLIATKPQDGVGRVGAGRRIAVLGDMLELGPTEGQLHAAIARHPGLEAIDLIHCVGPRMKALWQALPRGQRGEWVETAAELVPRARHLVDAGDIVLVKGSKGSKVSLIVDALRKMGRGDARQEGTE